MESTSHQRQAPILAGFIALGLLAVVLGTMNLKRLIGPNRPTSRTNAPTIPRTREELEQQQAAVLAGLDTDRDGLDDLTELERTKTSPFLSDSDSDGKTDKEEIESGKDPNCPEGKTCASGPPATEAPKPSGLPLDFPGAGFQPRGPSPEGAIVPPDVGGEVAAHAPSGSVASSPTPAELRKALERQGVDPAVLRQLTDAQLEDAYRSMLGRITQQSDSRPSPFGDALGQAFTSALLNDRGDTNKVLDTFPMDPVSIRELLTRGGFPAADLQKLDDKNLLSVWTQVIESLKHPTNSRP